MRALVEKGKPMSKAEIETLVNKMLPLTKINWSGDIDRAIRVAMEDVGAKEIRYDGPWKDAY